MKKVIPPLTEVSFLYIFRTCRRNKKLRCKIKYMQLCEEQYGSSPVADVHEAVRCRNG